MNALGRRYLITHQVPVIVVNRGCKGAKTQGKTSKEITLGGVDEGQRGAAEGPFEEGRTAPQIRERGEGPVRCSPGSSNPEDL